MRINHNIPALNAHRILSRNNTAAAGTMERLSSGRRINRAKDDAAGMAISEKMKTQIRGLRKASQNTLDGISLIQTAEGAMNEVHSMLQRMRELAVQSANGTTTDEDRIAIQAEVNQLTSEVNRIANGTEFNTRNLLRGNEAPNTDSVVHRLSTGAPAVVEGTMVTDADLQSEFLTIKIDGQERTVRLNSINATAGVNNRLEVINNSLGDLGRAVLLGGEGSTRFEIRTASIGGNSSVEIDGSTTALEAYGLNKGLYTGKAEIDTGNAQGTIYFQGTPGPNGYPEVGSTITIGNTKIEFYDSERAPYTGSNRPIDLYDQTAGAYRSTQDIIDIITDMEFRGIQSIEQDTTAAGAATLATTTESVAGASATGSSDFGGTTGIVTASGPLHASYNEYAIIFAKSGTITDPLAATVDTTAKTITVTWGNNFNPASMAAVNAAIKTATDAELSLTGDVILEEAGTFAEADLNGKSIVLNNAGITEVLGVYELAISQPFEDGDTVTINGVPYTYVEVGADPLANEFGGADATAQATNLATLIGGQTQFDPGNTTATGNVITITEAVGQATGVPLAQPNISGDSVLVPRIIFTAEATGFAGQAVYIEGTPKEFVANLQIGPNQGQGFRLSVGDIRADKLMISATSPDGNTGVTGAAFSQFMEVTDGLSEQKIQYAVDVSNEERATSAITVYNNAIVKVAQLRGELGAIQNRLEYTSANLDNTQENMTAALSRIEDADMALEMSEFTKMNVMLQAGTAMLAQANQLPQMVLQLLQ